MIADFELGPNRKGVIAGAVETRLLFVMVPLPFERVNQRLWHIATLLIPSLGLRWWDQIDSFTTLWIVDRV